MKSFLHHHVRRTTLIALGCSSFLGGLWLVQYGWAIVGWPWLLGAALLLGFCYKKRLWLAVPAIITCGFVCGLWRGTDMRIDLSGYEPFVGTQVELHGRVVEDPTYNDKGQQDARLTNVHIGDRELPGQVRITTYSLADFKRGDEVVVRGKLQTGFGNYQAAMYYATLEIKTINTGWVETMRRVFATSVYNNVPEPQASLGLGFLVGIKSQLPDTLNDQMRLVGLTHIVVASGYNLTILVRLARRLFEKRSKYQTLIASGGMVLCFMAVTGMSPSMTRASLVTGLSLLAWYYGRAIHPIVLLVLAAAITAGINPLFLWTDLGWWLSFLAFAGVMLLAPLLQKRIYGEREPKLLGQILVETISAQITTLPLIVMVFGVVAMLSLPANVLVVPLVPLAMALTFIAGVVGLVSTAVAPWVALPANWLLGYITELVKLFAQVEWASLPVSISPLAMLACYAGMAVIGLVLWRKTKHDYLSKSVIE